MNQSAGKILKIKELLKKNPQGMSITDLVENLQLNKNSIGRYLDSLLASGQVEMRRFGMAKVYTLSQRMPVSALLSLSPDLLFLLDNNLAIVHANNQILSILHVSPPELIGKNIRYSPLVPFFDEHFDRLLEYLNDGLHGTGWEGEIRAGNGNGSSLFWCRIFPMVFENGQIGVSVTLSDISEQRSYEEQILFQADILRDISEAVVATDIAGGIIYWNPAAERLFQYTPEEVLGKNFQQWILNEPKPETDNFIRGLMARMNLSTEHLAIRKDGSRVTISLSLSPRYDVEGSLVGFVGFAKDISDQKRAERKLRESEARYHTLFDHVRDGIILIDMKGTILMVNPAGARIFEVPDPGSVVGRNALNFIVPESRNTASQYMMEIRVGRISSDLNESRLIEFEINTESGRRLWLESTGMPFIYDKIPVILFTFRDITGRKTAEEKLRRSEERFRDLTDLLPLAIFEMDIGRNIVYSNKFGFTIFGLSSADIEKKPPAEQFLAPEDIKKMRRNLLTVAKGFPSTGDVYTFVKPDKTTFRAIVHTSPIVRDGKLEGFRGAIIDVTERIKLQEDLRANEEKFRMLFNNANDIIYLFGIDEDGMPGNLIEANEVACTMLGYSHEELLRMTPRDLYIPECIPQIERTLRQLSIDHHGTYERLFCTRDGRKLPVEISAHYFVRDGKEMVLAIARDVTTWKQLIAEIRTHEAKPVRNPGTPPDIVWVADLLEKNVSISQNIAEFTHRSLPDLGHSPGFWTTIVHPEDLPFYLSHYRSIMKTGIFNLEYRIVDPDGRVRWVRDRARLVRNTEGLPARIEGITSDITGEKSKKATRTKKPRNKKTSSPAGT